MLPCSAIPLPLHPGPRRSRCAPGLLFHPVPNERAALKERTNRLETPENTAPAQPDETPAAATTAQQAERRMRPRNGPSAAVEAPPPAPSRKFYSIIELTEMNPKQLLEAATEFNVTDLPRASTTDDSIMRILQPQTEAQANIFAQGILEIA